MNATAEYGRAARLMHWGMALLVFSAILLIEIKSLLPKGQLKHDFMIWHIQAGLFVFILIWPRFFWRLANPVPPVVPPLHMAQKLLAALAHIALYALMMALPVLGVLALESKGKAVHLLWLQLPSLVDEDTWLPHALSLKNYHELLGNVLIGLVAFHFAFAVLHHVLRRDDTLKRMLPWLRSRGASSTHHGGRI